MSMRKLIFHPVGKSLGSVTYMQCSPYPSDAVPVMVTCMSVGVCLLDAASGVSLPCSDSSRVSRCQGFSRPGSVIPLQSSGALLLWNPLSPLHLKPCGCSLLTPQFSSSPTDTHPCLDTSLSGSVL